MSCESRLHKLLNLLENSTENEARDAAGHAVRDIAAAHPQQLPAILNKIGTLLRNKRWDSRVAAGDCLRLLAQHFCHHSVDDLRRISSGDEADVFENKKQKLEKTEGKIADVLRDFDVDVVLSRRPLLVACGPRQQDQDDGGNDVKSLHKSLSARERNQMKRRQRSQEQRVDVTDMDQSQSIECPSHTDSIKVEEKDDGLDDGLLDGRWPFLGMFRNLMTDVLDPVWEIRHGAVLGLRELLSHQASSAGVDVPLVKDVPSGWAVAGKTTLRDVANVSDTDILKNKDANRKCLEECCAQLLELLVVDRMGDYLTDQAVAPVRETATQAFGCCLSALPVETIHHFHTIVQQMADNTAWEVRHSGYLLLKYLMISRRDLNFDIEGWKACVVRGLKDNIEDVRASAAEVLVPIAYTLQRRLSASELKAMIDVLWSDANLGDEDILNAAVPSVLDLLCKLYSTEEKQCMSERLNDRLPMLFRFFTHPSISVRTSAIRCFRQMLTLGTQLRPFLRQATRLIFFNLLTEPNVDILQLNEEVWSAVMDGYDDTDLRKDVDDKLMQSMMQLACTPIGTMFNDRLLEVLIERVIDRDRDLKVGSQFAGNPFRMRFATTKALAVLFERMPERHLILADAVQLFSATAQQTSALVVHFWEDITTTCAPRIPENIQTAVLELLDRNVPYTELLGHERKLRNDFGAFLTELMQHTTVDVMKPRLESLTPHQIEERSKNLIEADPHLNELMAAHQQHVAASAQSLRELHRALGTQVRACAAAAVVDGRRIPSKLNNIVRPLMAGIRTEREPLLQHLFATRLARLIVLCQKKKEAARRMVSNICTMACDEVVLESEPQLSQLIEKEGLDVALGVRTDNQDESIAKAGSAIVLQSLAIDLSADLFSVVPALQNEITEGLDQRQAQKIHCIELLQIVGPSLAPELLSRLKPFVERICGFCLTPMHSVRIAAARCCSRLVMAHLDIMMPVVLHQLLPGLKPDGNISDREGALIALHHILESLGSRVVPYIVLLIVPLLRLMANYDATVRTIASSSFGKLTSLIPLTPSRPPPNLTPDQQMLFQTNAIFVTQLLNNKKTGDFEVPNGLAVQLRHYQKEGINWMRFLRRFGLHGILADDMGLGKTIQTLISILISRSESGMGQSHRLNKEGTHSNGKSTSLVICPSTLISHWCNEARDQLPTGSLSALPFVGSVGDRMELRKSIHCYDLIVMSYETLRSDVQWISEIPWHYCVLDEGHIIRNTESKIWKACKAIHANHRLILSGTPVQNSVVELWALFDFLCPGFLGTKKDFMQQYGRIVHSARYAKKGTTEAVGSELALTALHKRVMPFILRRTKDEVLNDLPPKIIQDTYCDLSSIQKHLYEDFDRTQASEDKATETTSSFESLHYLRRLCSHPLLAIKWENPVHRSIVCDVLGRNFQSMDQVEQALSGLEHTPKLQILQQLLSECGILSLSSPLEDGQNGSHRMLIFAQLKGMLTIVEQQLLIPQQIPHLRLDGSVPGSEREHIVRLFNSDPTIPVMLLTTKVGGLGLNLTAADIVVFLEHDWNPRNDQQAMDRTHRLGQTRVVNVYRILTRGTVEEKIMNLQRFKMGIADSVINRDNMSLDAMDTTHLLDLFSYTDNRRSQRPGDVEMADEDYTDRYRKEFDMERYSKREDVD